MYIFFLLTYSFSSLDNQEPGEVKVFLEVNYSPVFHVFYEAFITFEGNLRQKGNKSWLAPLSCKKLYENSVNSHDTCD